MSGATSVVCGCACVSRAVVYVCGSGTFRHASRCLVESTWTSLALKRRLGCVMPSWRSCTANAARPQRPKPQPLSTVRCCADILRSCASCSGTFSYSGHLTLPSVPCSPIAVTSDSHVVRLCECSHLCTLTTAHSVYCIAAPSYVSGVVVAVGTFTRLSPADTSRCRACPKGWLSVCAKVSSDGGVLGAVEPPGVTK